MPIPAGLDAGLAALTKGPSAAFDPKHPNALGAELRMVFRFVEKSSGVVIKSFGMLAEPEQYSVQPGVRLTVHPTAGGYEVDIPEIDARGLTIFSLSGTSRVWPDGRGPGKPDGAAWLRGLQEMFDAYLQPTVMGIPRDQVELEFVNTDAPISASDPAGDSLFVVVPHQTTVSIARTARRSALYPYSVQICAYRRRHGPKREKKHKKHGELSFFKKLLKLVRDLNAFSFDQMFSRYQQLIAPVLQGMAAINDVKLFVNGYLTGVNTFIGYNMGLLRGLIETFSSAEQTVSETLGIGEGDRFGEDGAIVRRWASTRRSLSRSWSALTAREGLRGRAGAPAAPDEVGPGTGQPGGQSSPLDAANGRARLGLHDAQDGTDVTTGPVAAMQAVVTAGDTLERLRPQGFTDIDVIRLNRLRWPFVDGNRVRPAADPAPSRGTARVLYLGEPILLPSRGGAVGTAARADVAAESAESAEERLYGSDLYVDPTTRALAWDPATNDLATISGFDNLMQAIQHMLRLPLGSYPHAPDLGSHLLAESSGSWATDLQARLEAIAVQRTLTQDPRVQSVGRVTVTAGGGVTRVEFDLTPIDGVSRGRLALAS